jgi:hypothetical protein
MKIANIIHEAELVNHTKLDYINYFNEPKAYDDIDKSLPTLYVGWSFMKKCNPENPLFQNADILKKKIVTNELYWELSFREGKPSHVKGVNKFASLAPEFYFKPKFIYTNLDPVFFKLDNADNLMDVLPKKIDATYNYKNEMLYVLLDNKIWGIDLRMYEFFQFDISYIVMRMQGRSINNYNDLNGKTYQKYYKLFPNFLLLKRYLITILDI